MRKLCLSWVEFYLSASVGFAGAPGSPRRASPSLRPQHKPLDFRPPQSDGCGVSTAMETATLDDAANARQRARPAKGRVYRRTVRVCTTCDQRLDTTAARKACEALEHFS